MQKLICMCLSVLLVACTVVGPKPMISPLVNTSPLEPVVVTPTPLPIPDGGMIFNSSLEEPYICPSAGFCIPHGWNGSREFHNPCWPGKPGKSPCEMNCPDACQKDDGSGYCTYDESCYWAGTPEFARATLQFAYRIHSGSSAAKIFARGRMYSAYLWQQVYHVGFNYDLTFSAWLHAWQCTNYDHCLGGRVSDAPERAGLGVGIDPYGGTDPNSVNIIWSEQSDSFDVYRQYTVEATAANQVVTVFIRCAPRYSEFLRQDGNDCYIDDAALMAKAPPAFTNFVFLPIVER